MKALVCKNCGANSLVGKNGYMVCPYCDSHFVITAEECRNSFRINEQKTVLSYDNVKSSISLDDDVKKLIRKCEKDSKNAKKYANLILDIDPDNEEALKYI